MTPARTRDRASDDPVLEDTAPSFVAGNVRRRENGVSNRTGRGGHCGWAQGSPRRDGRGRAGVWAGLGWWPAPWAAAGATVAVAAILTIDLPFDRLHQPLPLAGPADWVAHVLTSLLLLAAIGRPRPTGAVVGVLAGSTLIDLDHLPMLLGNDLLTRETNRPLTHCLLAALLVAGIARLLPAGWRPFGFGVAGGILFHLARDLASSPSGVPLLWPLSAHGFILPYPAFVALILGCWGAVVWRAARGAGAQRA